MNNVGEIKKEKCCGCFSCYNSCLKKAIDMCKDSEGFWYPEIDMKKCVQCGKCLKACPNTNLLSANKYEHAYACYAKNEKEHMESSSGGFFAVLAKKILEEGGCVFGAAFNKDIEVEHIEVENIIDLKKVKCTKYVQSRIGMNYTYIRNELEAGRYVLFSGTPCQVAGLKTFLAKEYEKLLCVDLICHGVPSPEVWKRYLIEKFGKNEVVSMQFRNKTAGIDKVTLDYQLKSGKMFSEAYEESPYIQGVIHNFYIRPSCFQCQFKGNHRVSDITIGDFWSIKEFYPKLPSKYGISAVIIRTSKGELWMKKSSSDLHVYEAKVKEIAVWNENLNDSAKATIYRHLFYKMWNNEKISTLIPRLVQEEKEIEKKKPKKISLKKQIKRKLKKWLV